MVRAFAHVIYCLLITIPVILDAEVEVYQYPEIIVDGDLGVNRRSAVYDVRIRQGDASRQAYVMYDRNQEWHHNSLKNNPDHHWTNFSISGNAVVEVSLLDGSEILECEVYPKKKDIKQRIQNGKALIEIDSSDLPLQLWADVGGPDDQVLLIFADPLEPDKPDMTSGKTAVVHPGDSIEEVYAKLKGPSETVVFSPGIHQWGDKSGKEYSGYRMPVVDGKEIYIPGGAYVIGSFEAEGQGNWRIHGRGVLSACGKERLPGSPSIPWSMVHAPNAAAENQVVEGIFSICPPHFNLTLRGECVIDNVKMFGWWHQTDGTVTGDYSIVRNCFFKVMDDFIKVYSNHCYHENNTMFHGMNGAPFQLSWGNQNGDNNVMKNTYIVHSAVKPTKPINNTTVINARVGKKGNTTENNVWIGLFIDNGCNGLIGINANGGTYRDLVIQDVQLNSGLREQPQFGRSYLVDGSFENLVFRNIYVDGERITSTGNERDIPRQGKLWLEGDTSAVSFR